ncbi:MAG: DUF350 domain-containing protein [Candidatus Hydrogenedentes bacterium]|nr:DUF350 domain-containing protein [Candidatus Hydrogenedentota bacterium]
MDQISVLLQGLPSFLAYFGASIASLLVFCAIYLRITPHREIALIKEGKVAPAIGFAGAVLGYVLPIASVIANSLSLLDLILWAVIALIVQIAVFVTISMSFPGIVKQIADDRAGAAIFVGTISLAAGILNAACMTW